VGWDSQAGGDFSAFENRSGVNDAPLLCGGACSIKLLRVSKISSCENFACEPVPSYREQEKGRFAEDQCPTRHG
jgi:hypothetical protein